MMANSKNFYHMDKKSKMLMAVLAFFILLSVAVTFWRIIIKRDYIIENQIDCDPTMDACFIWECDPESTVEGEACTGDPEMDIWYYQIARRNAANIPLCDPETDETCDPWTCIEGEKDCSMTFCDEETKEDQGVECNDPVQYNIDNPAEEESECAEDDEECLSAEEEAPECEEGDVECEAVQNATECDLEAEDCAEAESEEEAADEVSAEEAASDEEKADTADAVEGANATETE